MSTDATTMTGRTLTITRELPASRGAVYRAWTEPEHLVWFFNDSMPRPSDLPTVDLRVGGTWRLLMVVNDELQYWTGGVYRDVVPDERLVFAWGATDGWPAIDPADLDAGPQVTVELVDSDAHPGGTRMDVTVELPEGWSHETVQEWLDMGIESGWRTTLDRLEA
ncbi:SRPBCC domain-containing protein [Cellulomonas sp. HZM]|uniref:SRPBCC family protein n=1 Tax=Cellulomonas sp. HZM TaxID=1454010 RepID=UPI0006921924|nr:SRPBCC domain-containing protein [Cellulomonas sp. HZM]